MKPISRTAYADAILARDDLSPEARKRIERVRHDWLTDEATVVRRSSACKRLDCKPTHERDLEREGKLDSFLDGKVRLIYVSSIYEHLIKQTLASYPLNKPPKKAPGSPNLVAVRALAPTARPHPVHERVAAPPVNAIKRGRGRPRKQIEMATPAE